MENLVDRLIGIRLMDSFEKEYLCEAAQMGEEKLLEAMRIVFGRQMKVCLLETVYDCCEQAEFILLLMDMEQEESDTEREERLLLINGCVDACERAYLLAQKEIPEFNEQLAFLVKRVKEAQRKAVCLDGKKRQKSFV